MRKNFSYTQKLAKLLLPSLDIKLENICALLEDLKGEVLGLFLEAQQVIENFEKKALKFLKQVDIENDFCFEKNFKEERLNLRKLFVLKCKNRGRDVAPFLEVLKLLVKRGYKKVLKLHTKKSTHHHLDNLWRRQLLTRLLGSREAYQKVKEVFSTRKEVGMIFPLGYSYSLIWYLGKNGEKRHKLLDFYNIETSLERYYFVAGSIFWFRPEAFKRLAETDLRKVRFEDEKGQVDGTLAHAYERLFGILPVVEGYKVVQLDEEGNTYEL